MIHPDHPPMSSSPRRHFFASREPSRKEMRFSEQSYLVASDVLHCVSLPIRSRLWINPDGINSVCPSA